MTIYKDDIKLFESKVMNDESDGGGEITGNEIVSGEHNSIFPDISDLDRAYGVVNIRSIHLKVDSTDGDTFYGATVGLLETPLDENVDVTLMSVNNPYIERDETKDIVERYLTSGVKYQGELMNAQLQGQRAIRIMQYPSRKLPKVGDVLVLRDKSTGYEQYCKLVKVSGEDQVFFEYNHGNYTLKIVTCEISEPLRQTFGGKETSPQLTSSPDSEVSETMVADASKYFGTRTLKEDALFNESTLRVDSIYSQLVPSARVDTPHINVPIVEMFNAPVPINASGTEETTFPINLESQSFPIDSVNQGYVYVQTLLPYPTPKTLMVHFMAQGNWYTLRDRGDGVLEGEDPAHGSGVLDNLGNVSVTLGALPDITSEVIFQWGSTKIHTLLVNDEDFGVDKTIKATTPLTPNTDDITFTWEGKTATCSNGLIDGDATGTVRGKNITFTPNAVPSKDAVITATWGANAGGVIPAQESSTSISMVDTGTQYTLSVGTMLEGEVHINLAPTDPLEENGKAKYTEESVNGVFRLSRGLVQMRGAVGTPLLTVGSYNGETGDIVIEKSLITARMTMQKWEKKRTHWWKSKSWTVTERTPHNPNMVATSLTASLVVQVPMSVSPPINAGSFDFNFDSLKIELDDRGVFAIADTIKFNFNGSVLFIQDDKVINGTTEVGTYDPDKQVMSLTAWNSGAGVPTVITGVYSINAKQYVQDMTFLTAGNPIASRSLQINAIDENGIHRTGVADEQGNITGDGFEGVIDTELGIVRLANDNLVESFDIKYNAVSYNYLPLDAELLGLDPIRLPSDGRVVIYQKGDIIVVHQDEKFTQVVNTPNFAMDLPHNRLVSCTTTAPDAIIDMNMGAILFPTTGTFDIEYRIEDMALISYVDISGSIKVTRPLSHSYDADKAKVASVLIASDLFSRYTNLFDQKSWTREFSDNLIGEEAPVSYNDTLYPIAVTNSGAITERMAIVFTSSTNFKLIGEHIGQIAVGDINTDFSPINPTSGVPYFTINKLGWGAGWSTNNVLRFNTVGAVYQMNVIRTILQGESQTPVDGDRFALQIRGNINKEVI